MKSLTAIFSGTQSLPAIADYEFRPQQLQMAEAIASSLESKEHLVVEAPTGVGKSLAYLIPAIRYALRNKKKAIISTHTKNLQEQLINKDIPLALAITGEDCSVAMFKGRRNYLCTTRLRNALAQQKFLFVGEELDELLRLDEWSDETADGDRERLPFRVSDLVWNQVCSEKGACSTAMCGRDCFFQKAKARARDAEVLVMNHALFFTLFAMQDSDEFFLFKDDFIIFDEAHTLENIAGVGIAKSISRAQVLFAVHRLFNPRTKKGLLARIKGKAQRQLCTEAEHAATDFFSHVESHVRRLSERSNSVRIRQPHFATDSVTPALQRLQSAVRDLEKDEKGKINKQELAAAKRLVWEAEILIKEFLGQADERLTYWVELGSGKYPNVYLHAAPTSVAESVAPKLFKSGTSVIMTSATLAVDGSLGYFQRRIGATTARTLVLDTPFDFQRQMRIVLAKGIPPPDQPSFEEALPQWVHRAITRSKGKALVLFTSSALMKRIAAQLSERLVDDGLTLLVQDGITPRHSLLESFKSDVHSVLFGLDSFWMGVDVPGEALEHVIITRLPFAVPDHPLTESRMEQITQTGGSAFFEYQLPEAILKLKQGVGRLIRTKTDKGLITILDSRILTKQYGRLFLSSLPRCPVEIADGDAETIEPEE
jgi:ATP-dependent DNA helicase DinG